MLGTFAALLAKSHIRSGQDLYRADITGDIEEVDGIMKITRINVKYSLKAPPDKRKEAQDAFNAYLPFCPAAQSVINCINISHELNLSS